MHDAEGGDAVFDERDIDGEAASLLDEFLGPVERIDQPEAFAHGAWIRQFAFFGDHWNFRGKRRQGVEDEMVGSEVRLGEG